MLTITQQKAGQRWDVITPALREALFSDVNADFVWNLCQNEHLTEEKSYQVAEISGYVLMGFLHPEDLAGELVSAIDLPAPLAKTISDQINARVFAPLRTDIDKVYSPPSKLGNIPVVPVPNTSSSTISSATPKPTILSDVGWSKTPASAVKENIPTPVPVPVPMQTPSSSSEPAPVMLHEDTVFKPAEKNIGFTLTKLHGGAEMDLGENPAKAPIRPALLEFSGTNKTSASSSKVLAPEVKLSFISEPMADSGARNIARITPPAQKPAVIPVPKPPTPPVPPTPRPPQMSSSAEVLPQPPKPAPAPRPQPSSPRSADKTIVKDFL